MFEAYFFDKRATINYRLYKSLKAMQGADFTINKLSKYMGMSYQQTYNAFNDIMSDLDVIAQTKSDEFTEKDFFPLAEGITDNQYRFYLLQQTIAFRFFDQLFQAGSIDVDAFCDVNQISLSTLRRRIDPYRQYLKTVQVDFNMATWLLDGEERHVRFAILTFFQIAYRGNGWPLRTLNVDTVTTAFKEINACTGPFLIGKRVAIQKIDLLILGVQLLRIRQNKVLSPSARMTPMIQGNPEIPDLIFTADNFPQLSSTTLTAERNFYYFSRSRLFNPGEQLTEEDHHFLDQFNTHDTPIKRFSDGLMNQLLLAFRQEKAEDLVRNRVLHTNILRSAFSYYALEGAVSNRLDFVDTLPSQRTSAEIQALIADFIQTFQDNDVTFSEYLPKFASELYLIVSTSLAELDPSQKLVVQVAMETETFLARDLFIFLRDVSFITFVTEPGHNPDVIVSSFGNISDLLKLTGTSLPDDTEVIYWSPESTDNDFFNLYMALKRIHNARELDATAEG